MDAPRALAMRGAEAIRAGVAAANDDDMLVFCRNRLRIVEAGHIVAFAAAVRLGEIFHGEVDTVQLSSRDVEIARRGGAPGEHDGVVFAEQLVNRQVDADVASCPPFADAFTDAAVTNSDAV